MTNSLFETVIDHALFFLESVYQFSDSVIWFCFTPFADVLDSFTGHTSLKPIYTLIATAIRTVGFEDVTLFSLMLTVGIGTYLIYQFTKWLIDILP